MPNWFVTQGNAERGPFTETQLKSLAVSGKVRPEDRIRREDQRTSIAASTVKGLFPITPPPLPTNPLPDPTAAKATPTLFQNKYVLALLIAAVPFTGLFFFCCCGLLGVAASKRAEEGRAEVAIAHSLWASGDKQQAAEKYRRIVTKHPSTLRNELPLIYGRLIDLEFEKGNNDEGGRLITQATDQGVSPSVERGDARTALSLREFNKAKKPDEESSTSVAKVGKRRTFESEDEVRLLILGKTPEEVVSEIGKPDFVHPAGRFTNRTTYEESWRYEKTIKHAATGKLRTLEIYFRGNRVIETGVKSG